MVGDLFQTYLTILGHMIKLDNARVRKISFFVILPYQLNLKNINLILSYKIVTFCKVYFSIILCCNGAIPTQYNKSCLKTLKGFKYILSNKDDNIHKSNA